MPWDDLTRALEPQLLLKFGRHGSPHYRCAHSRLPAALPCWHDIVVTRQGSCSGGRAAGQWALSSPPIACSHTMLCEIRDGHRARRATCRSDRVKCFFSVVSNRYFRVSDDFRTLLWLSDNKKKDDCVGGAHPSPHLLYCMTMSVCVTLGVQ